MNRCRGGEHHYGLIGVLVMATDRFVLSCEHGGREDISILQSAVCLHFYDHSRI